MEGVSALVPDSFARIAVEKLNYDSIGDVAFVKLWLVVTDPVVRNQMQFNTGESIDITDGEVICLKTSENETVLSFVLIHPLMTELYGCGQLEMRPYFLFH